MLTSILIESKELHAHFFVKDTSTKRANSKTKCTKQRDCGSCF